MHGMLIVGVYRSESEAENARHRLITEGVDEADIIERVIGEVASEETLTRDLRRKYELMPPGEVTLVAVKVPDLEQAEAVESIMMMFAPKQIDRHELIAGRLVVASG